MRGKLDTPLYELLINVWHAFFASHKWLGMSISIKPDEVIEVDSVVNVVCHSTSIYNILGVLDFTLVQLYVLCPRVQI